LVDKHIKPVKVKIDAPTPLMEATRA
jgi:hypothetical protein